MSELNELLKTLVKKRVKIMSMNQDLKVEKAELENIEDLFMEKLLEAGITSFKNKKGMSVSLSSSTKYSVLKSDSDKLHDWLKGNGYESIMSVHAGTLSSFFADYEGEMPEFVNEFEKKGLSIGGIK